MVNLNLSSFHFKYILTITSLKICKDYISVVVQFLLKYLITLESEISKILELSYEIFALKNKFHFSTGFHNSSAL